jgi:hypothetical protein
MKALKSLLLSSLVVLSAVIPISITAASVTADTEAQQVQIPIVVDLSYAIAGAELAFTYSDGLEFISYQKSEALSSALTTPVVVKNGITYLGFYNTTNAYAPTNGKLNLGVLIFSCNTEDTETVTLSQIKLVTVIDRETTESRFLDPREFTVSSPNIPITPTDNPGTTPPVSSDTPATGTPSNPPPGGSQGSNNWVWFIIIPLIVAVCIYAFIIIKRRRD